MCGGGPAPGINTVISTLAKTFLKDGYEVIGVHHGYKGLLSEDPSLVFFDFHRADRIFSRGGSTLIMSRYKPKDSDFKADFFKKHNVKLLVTIGGDDTASTANRLTKYVNSQNLDVAHVHVPKTIDNDLSFTDFTFGFQTAVDISTDAIDKLVTTAASHHRIFVLEVMGRYAGWIALHAAIAGGAEVCLIPEIPYDLEKIKESLMDRIKDGPGFAVIVIAEGAKPIGGEMSNEGFKSVESHEVHLKGAGEKLVSEIDGLDLTLQPDGFVAHFNPWISMLCFLCGTPSGERPGSEPGVCEFESRSHNFFTRMLHARG